MNPALVFSNHIPVFDNTVDRYLNYIAKQGGKRLPEVRKNSKLQIKCQ